MQHSKRCASSASDMRILSNSVQQVRRLFEIGLCPNAVSEMHTTYFAKTAEASYSLCQRHPSSINMCSTGQ